MSGRDALIRDWTFYYDAGWNAALEAVREVIPKLPTYDENGLMHAIGELQQHAGLASLPKTMSTQARLDAALKETK